MLRQRRRNILLKAGRRSASARNLELVSRFTRDFTLVLLIEYAMAWLVMAMLRMFGTRLSLVGMRLRAVIIPACERRCSRRKALSLTVSLPWTTAIRLDSVLVLSRTRSSSSIALLPLWKLCMYVWKWVLTSGLRFDAGLLSSSSGMLAVNVETRVIPRWPFPEHVCVPPAGLSLNTLRQWLCCRGLKLLRSWFSTLTILLLANRGYRPILFGMQVILWRNLIVLCYGLWFSTETSLVLTCSTLSRTCSAAAPFVLPGLRNVRILLGLICRLSLLRVTASLNCPMMLRVLTIGVTF